MWRVLAVVTIVSAIWGVGTLLPKNDAVDAEQVAVSVGIATQGNPNAAITGVRAAEPGEPALAAAPQVPAPSEVGSWKTNVSAAPAGSKVPVELDEAGKAELVMSLQRELRRVGCYRGRINGMWNRTTRRAVTEFAEQVALAAPGNDPDPAVLEAAARMENRACGTPCAIGQKPNAEGRCRPVETETIASREAAQPAAVAVVPEPVEATRKTEEEESGPIVVASVVESGGDAASAGEPVPTPALAEQPASEDVAQAVPARRRAAALDPNVAKPRKRRVVAQSNVLPADAFAPMPSAGRATRLAASHDRSTAERRAAKRTVIATLDGPLPAASRKASARRYNNTPSYAALGAPRKQRFKAAQSATRVAGKGKRRVGYATALRNYIKSINGGSLR